jgi:hypothetical protein
MAHKTVVLLIDDLDGSSTDGIKTVDFALDGASYEIDLHEGHADELRGIFAEFIRSARRTGGRMKRGLAVTSATAGMASGSGRSPQQAQAIREWAKKKGYPVSDRGRIPAAVLEDFEANAGKPKTRKWGK